MLGHLVRVRERLAANACECLRMLVVNRSQRRKQMFLEILCWGLLEVFLGISASVEALRNRAGSGSSKHVSKGGTGKSGGW